MTWNKVISQKNLPVRLPLVSTVVLWLLLDRLQVHGVLLGLVWGLWGVICTMLLLAFFLQEPVDIFEKKL